MLDSGFVEGRDRVIAEFFLCYPRMRGVRRRLFFVRYWVCSAECVCVALNGGLLRTEGTWVDMVYFV